MLRSNLSTRPFYNERLVSLAIALAALAGLALTAFNVTQIASLTRQRSVYARQIENDRNEAARIRTAAAAIQKSVDQRTLLVLKASTVEANGLIDQRTFSWTGFFELVETTLPFDVRLVAVSPRVEKGQFLITMVVIGRKLEDVQRFTDALQETGAFYDVGPSVQNLNEDGTLTATIQAGYLSRARKGRP